MSQGNLEADLSNAQLRGVALVALQFNEVEFLLDCILYSGLDLNGQSWTEVISQLSLDAKLALVDTAIAQQGLPDELNQQASTAVRRFQRLKTERNNVVHCRVLSAQEETGQILKRRGVSQKVQLSEAGLNKLYSQLKLSCQEFHALLAFLDMYRTSKAAIRNGLLSDFSLQNDPTAVHFFRVLSEAQAAQKALE